MSEEWKTLTEAEKQVYQATSDREKEKYDRDMKVFREKIAKQGEAAADAAAQAKGGEKIVGKKRPATAPAAPVKAAPAPKGKVAKPVKEAATKKVAAPKRAQKEEIKHEDPKPAKKTATPAKA